MEEPPAGYYSTRGSRTCAVKCASTDGKERLFVCSTATLQPNKRFPVHVHADLLQLRPLVVRYSVTGTASWFQDSRTVRQLSGSACRNWPLLALHPPLPPPGVLAAEAAKHFLSRVTSASFAFLFHLSLQRDLKAGSARRLCRYDDQRREGQEALIRNR